MNKNLQPELSFKKFIKTINGISIEEYYPDNGLKTKIPNADFYLPSDNIIVEFKELKEDSINSSKGVDRILKYIRNQKSENGKYEILKNIMNGEPMPDEFQAEIKKNVRRNFESAIKKAIKQLLQTKILLDKPKATSILVICNDGNLAYDPKYMFSILCKLMADNFNKSIIDCVIYFTMNLPAQEEDNSRELIYWLPVYKESHNEKLSNYINKFGADWFMFYKELIGEQNLTTPHYTGVDAFKKLNNLKN